MPDLAIIYQPVTALSEDPRNPRVHSRKHLNALARSIKAFGFTAPILVNKKNKVIAGHGRLGAAKLLGMERVPVISLDNLTEVQAQAYMLADNRLNERSSWDEDLLAIHLKELSAVGLDFDIEDTGFEIPDIDRLLQAADPIDDDDAADEFSVATGPAVTKAGDIWTLGNHRLICGDALKPEIYVGLFEEERAAAVFGDVPYNVKIGGISGLGKTKHREFAMASGEMTEAEFTEFLETALSRCKEYTHPGSLIYACIDWRHLGEMTAAGKAAGLEHKNLCVWVKSNGGMGALYRSRHELVFVFRNGSTPHRNNVQLGKFGRNRTNVWNYAGATSFPRKSSGADKWQAHPTVKPIRLVADAILDSTAPGDVVLDPFAGSGTSILAAERTGRQCRAIELDTLYVDTAITRWQNSTGEEAFDAEGRTFAERQKGASGQ